MKGKGCNTVLYLGCELWGQALPFFFPWSCTASNTVGSWSMTEV